MPLHFLNQAASAAQLIAGEIHLGGTVNMRMDGEKIIFEAV